MGNSVERQEWSGQGIPASWTKVLTRSPVLSHAVTATSTPRWNGFHRRSQGTYKIFDQAMHMADALTDGIVKQFPNK